jgi:hypothetical protein
MPFARRTACWPRPATTRDSAPGPPKEAALELLQNELGARRIDAAEKFGLDSGEAFNEVREHGSAAVGCRRGMVSGRATAACGAAPHQRRTPSASATPSRTAPEDRRSAILRRSDCGVFDDDRQPLSPNDSRNPDHLSSEHARRLQRTTTEVTAIPKRSWASRLWSSATPSA